MIMATKLIFAVPALLVMGALAIEMPALLGKYMSAVEAGAVVAILLALALTQIVAFVRE